MAVFVETAHGPLFAAEAQEWDHAERRARWVDGARCGLSLGSGWRVLRPAGLDTVIRGGFKELRRRLVQLKVVELIRCLTEAWVGRGGLDYGCDAGGKPCFGDDDNGTLVANLAGGDGDGLLGAFALYTFDGLLAEVLGDAVRGDDGDAL